MEEDVELIDYLKVIWKRKILIIVGSSVCMVVVGVVCLFWPVTYHADAIIKIGKKVCSQPTTTSLFPSFDLIDTSKSMVETIPFKYVPSNNEGIEYHLSCEIIGTTPMLRIIMEGNDRRVEKLLKEIVNRLIQDHNRVTESSTLPYILLTNKLESDAKEIQETIDLLEAMVKKMSSVEVNSDFYTFMYNSERANLKNDLIRSKNELRDITMQLLLKQVLTVRTDELRTRLVGEVSGTVIKLSKKSKIMTAGVVGIVMFIFLAFFVEYLNRVKAKSE